MNAFTKLYFRTLGVCSLERQSCLQNFQFQKCFALEPIRFPMSWRAKVILNPMILVSWNEEGKRREELSNDIVDSAIFKIYSLKF